MVNSRDFTTSHVIYEDLLKTASSKRMLHSELESGKQNLS